MKCGYQKACKGRVKKVKLVKAVNSIRFLRVKRRASAGLIKNITI